MTDLNPKEIGRRAGRIFAYHLPPHWVLRSQEDQEDYGVDAEVEIVSPEDKATGFIFKAQIKGQLAANLINQGTQISFNLSVDRLRYYMQQIEMPLILVVVDVTTESIYWASLQDNEGIAEDLRTSLEKGQKTVAIRLQAEDTIPGRSEELLSAVQSNMDWLRLHALDRLSGPIGSLIKKSTSDVLEKLLHNNKKLSFEIYNEHFDRLFRSKDFDELFNATSKVIKSPTELVETRITAGLYIERLILQSIDRLNPNESSARAGLYQLMLGIVRHEKTSIHIRQLVVALIRILRLELFVNSDYHYFISSRHVARESLTGWILNTSRLQVSRQAGREIVKTVLFINRTILAGHQGVFLDALPRLAAFVTLFTHRLNEDGLRSQAEYLLTWLKFCVDLAISVATETKNTDALVDAISANALSALDEDGKASRIAESQALTERIEDAEVRERVRSHLNVLKEEITTEQSPLTPEKEIEYFRTRALGLGFDVDNPDDEMGQIIRQGLLDYNPERVVKDCELLIMVPTRSLGVPAHMVGLPSAAMKFLYCLKKGQAMGGWRLDDIYNSPVPDLGFKEKFCKDCEFRQPRSESWKWSSQWQQEIAEQYKEIFDRLNKF